MTTYINKDGKREEVYSSMLWDFQADPQDLVGRVVTEVFFGQDEIILKFEDEYTAKFYHEQDCCESVWVEDVNGDFDDLFGTPLLVSEARSEDNPNAYESGTYTFYTFRTIKGSVDVRWCGASNGYYSERVDLVLYKEIEENDS